MLPLLIGGAPCAGKSTLSASLAAIRGVSFASVDDIREAFQNSQSTERHHYPWLFSSHQISAEDFWKTLQPADLVEMEVEQARELWPTIKKLIASGQYGILEGVSLVPELIWQDFGKDIQAIFLIDPDRQRVKETIFQRGLWGEAHTYADWIKPLEVEWVMLHNDWCREQAKRFPYPLVEVKNRSDVVLEVTQLLNKRDSA